jgi:hypothetical protein
VPPSFAPLLGPVPAAALAAADEIDSAVRRKLLCGGSVAGDGDGAWWLMVARRLDTPERGVIAGVATGVGAAELPAEPPGVCSPSMRAEPPGVCCPSMRSDLRDRVGLRV